MKLPRLLFAPASKNPPPPCAAAQRQRRVLLVKLDRIGDYLLFRNTLRALRESAAYRNARLTILGNAVWREIAMAFDAALADEWIWIENASSLFGTSLENLLPPPIRRKRIANRQRPIRETIRNLHFDEIISARLYRDRFLDDFLSGLAPMLIGPAAPSPLPGDAAYTRLLPARPPQFPGLAACHIPVPESFVFSRNCDFVSALTGEPCTPKLELELPPVVGIGDQTSHLGKQPAVGTPDPDTDTMLVILCPAASHWSKMPRRAVWLQLARWFLRHTSATIAFAGGSDAIRPFASPLARLQSPRIQNWIGSISLPELARRMQGASLVIANDSAPAHLAALSGAPTVCIANGYAGRHDFWPYPDGRLRVAFPLRTIRKRLSPLLPVALFQQWRAIRSITAGYVLSTAAEWADALKKTPFNRLALPWPSPSGFAGRRPLRPTAHPCQRRLTAPAQCGASPTGRGASPSGRGASPLPTYPPPGSPPTPRTAPAQWRILIASSENAPWYESIQDVDEHARRQPYTLGAIMRHLYHTHGWDVAWTGRHTTRSICALGQKIAAFKPDIIYTYGAFTALHPILCRLLPGAAGAAARAATIVHGWDDAYGDIWGDKLGWPGRFLMNAMEHLIVTRSDHVVTLSRFLQARGRSWNVEATYIPNGADPLELLPPSEENAVRLEGALKIVYTGDQARWKQTADICKAMRHVPSDIKLYLTGRHYPYLDRYASPNCIFLGFVSKERQFDIMRQADAFVCTADQDCNAKLQEYLRWKKPYIGFDGRANLIFQNGRNALLVHDYAPLLEALRATPSLSGMIANHAETDIPVLSWAEIAFLFDTLFRSLRYS
ncbi:MAG: glycosyltransferase family 9 protein [Kiritimatiellia bacterium]